MTEPHESCAQQLAALREAGAQRHDPVGFRYLESLTERLAASRHPAHQNKLRQALETFRDTFLREQQTAAARLETLVHSGWQRQTLLPYLQTGDFKALHRLAATPPHTSPLATLLSALQAGDNGDPQTEPEGDRLTTLLRQQQARLDAFGAGPVDDEQRRRPLKAARHLLAAQARLHTRHRIRQAFVEAPSNAGPLNSHRLVAQALERLGDLAPGYLEHFARHMEVLMALEKVRKKS